MMEEVEGHGAEGYVKEFTRHSSDVLLNLNELRHRNFLTDATLVVGAVHLRAHCAVLVACSGFFYSMYSRRVLLQGREGGTEQLMTVSLPNTLDPSSVSLLLDFMYTSRLPLTPRSVPGVLAVATYLQMDHVADTCRAFMQLHRDKMSAAFLHLELDSRVPVASVAPKGGDLPNPSPRTVLRAPLHPAADAAKVPADIGVSAKPGAFPTHESGSQALKRQAGLPLSADPSQSPDSPCRSSGQPNSPSESSTCSIMSDIKPTPDPKACNWKKYKYIVLNPLCAVSTVKEEEPEEQQTPISDQTDPKTKTSAEGWPGEVPGQIDRQGQASCYEGSGRAPPLGSPPSVEPTMDPSMYKEESVSPCSIFPKPCLAEPAAVHHGQHTIKHESYYTQYCYSGSLGGTKTVCAGDKPYRCNVCGAQFNRPANLKTHSRIHSGEKPYRCDTCSARFVQVAHLRAHVLIHTGEKPYPCHTCGTRFRHLQTLKSHLRIHTGEKPYTCEKCDLHFRHKSQLRLHLRQKHGAITNTKVRYKILTEPYQPIIQAC
ncbi:B-cell lymphoma 6 protein [Lampris incognitus]|uniref:B-cell lymphoma 6 protein n=1 Tax=Lampris incognitus TaxID=2546036 RepID=UPI0024B4F501|nr:B-cell lymphoma 6 protein [Lampris incognitus]